MTKGKESKTLRDARMRAKTLSRNTELSHQQALDHIARESGYRNWSAMSAADGGVSTSPEGKPAAAAAGKLDRRKVIHEARETGAIEDAASLARRLPAWALPFVPALTSMLWVALFITPLLPLTTAAAMTCITGAIVAASAILVRLGGSNDARVLARRRMATGGRILGWGMIAIGGVAMVFEPLIIVLSGMTGYTGAEPYLSLVVSMGIMIVNTGVNAQKAMAIASPDTVRPSKHVSADAIGFSDSTIAMLRRGVTYGLTAGIGGVAVLLGAAIASLFMSVAPVLIATAIVIMGLGIAAAMASVTAMMAMSYRRDVDPIRHRAARAQRLLKVSH